MCWCANCFLNRRPETLQETGSGSFEGVRSNSTVLSSSSSQKDSRFINSTATQTRAVFKWLRRVRPTNSSTHSCCWRGSNTVVIQAWFKRKTRQKRLVPNFSQGSGRLLPSSLQMFWRVFYAVASAALAIFAPHTLAFVVAKTGAALSVKVCVMRFGSGQSSCAHHPTKQYGATQ